MLILLPPSEGKTGRSRGRRLELDRLSFPALNPTRQAVASALVGVSARSDAAELLGVSPGATADIARNLVLHESPTLPAGQVYSGVLYAALDLTSMDSAARRRAHRWIVVVSALYGAVRLTDPIAPYRLSMAVNLPGAGPLGSVWRPQLSGVLPDAAGHGLVVDCRSSTYAGAWAPGPALASRWVQVRVPGASHMAKQTRGLVARHLCVTGADPRRPEQLVSALCDAFDVALTPPARPSRPWVLDALAS